MTETTQIQPATINSTATPEPLTINHKDAEIHLAILGDRENYFVFSKNCALYDKDSKDPNAKKNMVLQKNEIIQAVEQLNRQGYTFWISLNPKTADANINVTHLSCFYMEIDARSKGIKDRLATQQELSIAKEKALTLKAYFEKHFGAVSFIAYSGNGYHLLYPLPITELTPELTKQLSKTDTVANAKIRTFTQRAADGYGIDTVCDINRKTTLIGSYNLKLTAQPIQTTWLKDHIPETHEGALLQVDYARRQNKLLLDTILATSIEQPQQPTPTNNIIHAHAKLEEILATDPPLNNLYNGNYDKRRYRSRSEAEAAVLTILFGRHGFSTDEAREAMENCRIGKWQERRDSYQDTTIQHALKWVMEHPTEQTAAEPLLKNQLTEENNNFSFEEPTLSQMTDQELKEILGTTVKHDDGNKVITFLSFLCTYTEEDQINLGYIAESSSGKSYIPIELSCYFPEKDIITLGYCSPTAFFHDAGTLIPDPENPERKVRFIDLKGKILIFLDQPHVKLLENMRPLFSHDEKIIRLKITNKSEKSGNRAENILVQGFSTVAFCTANYKQDDQEKTRLLLLSPEHTQEKLREAILLKIEKESDRLTFAKKLKTNPQRAALINRVKAVKNAHINQIIIPSDIRQKITVQFMEKHKFLQSRNQRDISRLLSIIKGNALLNYQQRNLTSTREDETDYTTITATEQDVEIGFKYYGLVSGANERGIPPELEDFYDNHLKIQNDYYPNGFSRKEISKIYFEARHKTIGREAATKMIQALENAGLLVEQPDPTDKRVTRYVCEGGGVEKSNKTTNELIKECHTRFGIGSIPHPSNTHITHSKEADFDTVAYCEAIKKEDTQPNQPCSVCQQTKPLAYTYRHYDGKDGVACFECGDKIRCNIDQRD